MLQSLGAPTPARPRWTSGYYYVAADGVRGTLTLSLNRLYLLPLDAPIGATIDRIGTEVSTAGAATAVLRLGLYAATTNGAPVTLLSDFGTVDATTTGGKELTVSRALGDTRVWAAVACQGAASTTRTVGTGQDRRVPIASLAVALGTNGQNGLYLDSVSGALPSSLTLSALSPATHCPWTIIRAA